MTQLQQISYHKVVDGFTKETSTKHTGIWLVGEKRKFILETFFFFFTLETIKYIN